MDLLTLISLIVATFIYAISPGPGLFAVLAIATRFGPVPAIWLSLGHTIGDIIYVALAMLALSALAELINNSMLYVKILGASYLIFIDFAKFNFSLDFSFLVNLFDCQTRNLVLFIMSFIGLLVFINYLYKAFVFVIVKIFNHQ